MTMTSHRTIFAVLALAAGATLGACAGDGASDATERGATSSDDAAATSLRIEAGEFSFSPADLRAAPGTVAVEYVNVGAIQHTLVIDGVQEFKLDVASAGDVDTGTVNLQPGTYTLFCDVPGHRQAGMEAPLTIA